MTKLTDTDYSIFKDVMSEQEIDKLKRFDIAAEHAYECNCELCQEYWAQMEEEDAEHEMFGSDSYSLGEIGNK